MITNRKNILIGVASVLLFIGCGSGSNTTPSSPSVNTQQESTDKEIASQVTHKEKVDIASQPTNKELEELNTISSSEQEDIAEKTTPSTQNDIAEAPSASDLKVIDSSE